MKFLLQKINQLLDVIGWICIIALLLMIANVFIDVFVRYAVIDIVKALNIYPWYDKHFSWLGGIGMQELEKHWFSLMFLFGLSYTLKENGHVRVDVFYDNFSRRTQAIINIVGAMIFTIPFSILLLDYGWDFFISSYESGENKGDPGSLPRLWPFKLMIPIAFLLLILSAISVILSEAIVLKGEDKEALS